MSQHVTDPLAVADVLGPLDLVLVEFPSGHVGPAAFAHLVDLARRDVIRVLDLEFVRKGPDGEVWRVDNAEVAGVDGVESVVGASSGLLDTDDLARAGDLIGPRSLCAVILVEQTWPLAMAAAEPGARVVAHGSVAPAELDALLAEGLAEGAES